MFTSVQYLMLVHTELSYSLSHNDFTKLYYIAIILINAYGQEKFYLIIKVIAAVH